jgi:arylsulfatase
LHAGQPLADELFSGRYVIRDQWKLVSVQAPFGSSDWQLYDVSTDRGETIDLAAAHPDIAADLAAAYDAYATRSGVIAVPAVLSRAPAP